MSKEDQETMPDLFLETVQLTMLLLEEYRKTPAKLLPEKVHSTRLLPEEKLKPMPFSKSTTLTFLSVTLFTFSRNIPHSEVKPAQLDVSIALNNYVSAHALHTCIWEAWLILKA